MPDAADGACVHMVDMLGRNAANARIEWACADCGKVHAWLTDEAVLRGGPSAVEVWGARHGIPDRKLTRLLREMAA